MSLFFVSCELAIDGALDGAAKLRQCQFVLPFFCSGEDGLVFFGAKRVSFFSTQIISGASVFVGDGSVGSCCFIPAKGCELPVIPLGGMWIPAVSPAGGGRWSRRFLGVEDADVLSTFTYGLTVGLGDCLLRLYMRSSSLRSAGKHGGGRRAALAPRRREDGRSWKKSVLQTSPSRTSL